MDFPPIDRKMTLKQFNLNEFCLCVAEDAEIPIMEDDEEGEDGAESAAAEEQPIILSRRPSVDSDSYNPVS